MMRLVLNLPAGMTFEEVVDGLAHAGWKVLTLPPELHQLYPGYWVAARAIIFDHLNKARQGAAGSAQAEHEIELVDTRDLDGFVAALADAIMRRLEGAHCGTCGVECAATHLPEALRHALELYRKPEEGPANAGIAPPSRETRQTGAPSHVP